MAHLPRFLVSGKPVPESIVSSEFDLVEAEVLEVKTIRITADMWKILKVSLTPCKVHRISDEMHCNVVVAFLAGSTVEFTKEEMCSYDNGPWQLRPWFVFSSKRRIFLFGMICFTFFVSWFWHMYMYTVSYNYQGPYAWRRRKC